MKTNELAKGSFNPSERISYAAGSIVSQELIDDNAGSITLFSFDAGQGLSEHTAPYDAAILILDGEAEITLGGTHYQMKHGEMLVMPANTPHSVSAVKAFKMMLTMIKGN
jgi:quercetin dioxygenase-like cupin family protein